MQVQKYTYARLSLEGGWVRVDQVGGGGPDIWVKKAKKDREIFTLVTSARLSSQEGDVLAQQPYSYVVVALFIMTEFFIPWNYEDLLRQSRSTAYYVKEQYEQSEISSRLDGHGFLYNDLHALLSENVEADRAAYAENLKENRNILQMNVYLLAQMVERFENALSSNQNHANIGAVGKLTVRKGTFESIGRRQKKIRSDAGSDVDWEEQKTRLLQTLNETLLLPLHLLWSPPIVDDQFVK
uniref:Condensin complex subunit 1 N-terminal domain-containing protein n=1 Tax=Romanomermis culicivorax TaxID=13658 RepID=A0A915J867_ROMCU